MACGSGIDSRAIFMRIQMVKPSFPAAGPICDKRGKALAQQKRPGPQNPPPRPPPIGPELQSQWILDVLADLKAFAISADLPKLAEHLEDSALVAYAEISAHEEKTKASGKDQSPKTRN
jgi:hypothetical protein